MNEPQRIPQQVRVVDWSDELNGLGGYRRPISGHVWARHCPSCGLRCEEWVRFAGRYDEIYGKPVLEYQTVCPRREHWWDGHHRSRWNELLYVGPRPDPQ